MLATPIMEEQPEAESRSAAIITITLVAVVVVIALLVMAVIMYYRRAKKFNAHVASTAPKVVSPVKRIIEQLSAKKEPQSPYEKVDPVS